jgi:hypothetical protein
MPVCIKWGYLNVMGLTGISVRGLFLSSKAKGKFDSRPRREALKEDRLVSQHVTETPIANSFVHPYVISITA